MKLARHIRKGFTLLETLASVAILSLVIVGPLAVTISSSGYARQAKDNMVANYLAEEAVELLQNQYDSMYVYCKKYEASTEVGGFCYSATETTGQTSWRLFKNKLSSAEGQGGDYPQPTCYLPNGEGPGYTGDVEGNASGCAFDYAHMVASSTQVLTRYNASTSACKYLVPVSTSTSKFVPIEHQTNGYINTWVNSTSTSYVCSGVSAHKPAGALVLPKQYVRNVMIEQLPTFEVGAANTQYSDDLRITSNVTFKALNGTSHTVKIIRFMHARP